MTAGCSSSPNTEALLSLYAVGATQNGHRMSDRPLESTRDLDVARAAGRQKHLGSRLFHLTEERLADRLGPVIVLGAHAVRARDATAGVLDRLDGQSRNELEEAQGLLGHSLSHGVAGVVVDDRERNLGERGVQLAAVQQGAEVLVDIDGVI